MIRGRTLVLAIVMLSTASPLLAQTKAKAENVPEIPYHSVPNFLKLPPNLYLGEGIGVATNSKGHVFVYTRSGDTRLFEFDQNGAFVREIGQGLYGFEFAHAVRVDARGQHLGGGRRHEHGHQVQPRGTRGDGARPPARSRSTGSWRLPPAARRRRRSRTCSAVRPTSAGTQRQHLRLRRLRQLARREVRQERPLRQGGRHARQRAGPVQHAALDRRSTRKGNVYVGDRSNARVQVLDNDLNFKAIYDNVGSPWAVCISPGPHQYLFVLELDSRQRQLAQSATITGEIYKMELDGTIIGKFGKAGKQLGEFSTVHEIDCRNPERAARRGDHRLARAEDHPRSRATDVERGRQQ